MGAKQAILERIRAAVRASPPEEIGAARYRQNAAVDLAVFEERLTDYGVGVFHASVPALAQVVAQVLTNAGKQRILIPPGFPKDMLPSGFEFVVDSGLSYGELDRVEGVLTLCAVAVAETGTIFLRHTQAEGRRALTLLPDYHLCIVSANQVVATVPEAIRIAAGFGTSPITTISGPSATSDIEMTRVKGVHGPRTLEVILATA